MNTDPGRQTKETHDEADNTLYEGCRSKNALLFTVVAPLSAITFWIAGWTAHWWLEGIRRSNQEYVHADFGATAITSIFLPFVILIVIGIAWLILIRSKVPRGFVIPTWTAIIAATIALLVIAGQPTTDFYTSWWPLVALGFDVCLGLYIGFLSHRE